MSIKKYTYLFCGIRLNQNELPFDVWDDKYLPYTEGHEGVKVIIVPPGESSNNFVYIGKSLASSDPYSDEISIKIALPPYDILAQLIFEAIEIKVGAEDIGIWFFDRWY